MNNIKIFVETIKKFKYKLLIAALVIFGIFLSLLVVNFIGKTKTNIQLPVVNNSNYDYQTEKAILAKEFKTKSSKEVFEIFKERYKSIDQFKIHNLVHWIGIEIYAHSGMEGLLICDETFSYGCYHGFFIKAFEKEGKSLYTAGEKYCLGDGSQLLKYGGCIHGLGHGVLYINGYDLTGLSGALKDCSTLELSGAASGCNNGAFMEFNARTMQSLETGEIKARQFDSDKPFYPCNLLETKYQPNCFYEISNWWTTVLSGNFETMVKYCSDVTGTENKKSCFGGIGRMASVIDMYQGSRVKEVCLLISNSDYWSYCIEKSIEVLLGVGKSDSINFCDLLDDTEAKSCREKMTSYYCVISDKCQRKQ